MSYANFPATRPFLVVTASDTPIAFGKIDLASDIEMYQIQAHIVKNGAHAANTKLRLHISPNEAYNVPLATSAWIDVSEIDSLTSSPWAGYLTFTFDRTELEAANDYWIHVEVTGYTNPGDDSYYWGFALDWPEALNTAYNPLAPGGAMTLAGYL